MNNFENIWAIQQVYFTYGEAIDSKDFARLKDVFTPDALFDHTRAHGSGAVFRGLNTFIERLQTRMGPDSNCGATHHNAGNFRIAITGATARAKVNCIAAHRGQNAWEGALYLLWAEYDDDLMLTPNGWRISTRRFSIALREGPAITGTPPAKTPAAKQKPKKKLPPRKKKRAKPKRGATSRKRPRRR